MRALGVTAWLFLPGALPAVSLVGRTVLSIPFAALLTALGLSVASMLAIWAGTSVLPWYFAVVVAGQAEAIRRLRRRPPVTRPPIRDIAVDAVLLLVVAFPLVGLRRAAIDWDARSIWLFHSRWFYAGGDFIRDALVNPAFSYSHPDYPPLAPAAAGGLWRLTANVDVDLGRDVIALLTFNAVAVMALAVRRLASERSAVPAAAMAALVGLGAYGLAGPYGTNGYVDLLWAASATAGVLYLLAAPMTPEHMALGAACLAVAGVTKNEGLAAAVLVLGLSLARHRQSLRTVAVLGTTALFILAWPVLMRTLGVHSDIAAGGRASALLHGDPEATSRVGPTIAAITGMARPIGFVAIGCAAFGALMLRTARRRLGLGSAGWTWLAILLITASLVAAYVLSPYDLDYHLASSADRTTIALRLLLLSEVACWTLCATEALQRGDSPSRAPVAVTELRR